MITLEDNHEKLYGHIVGRVCNTCRHRDMLKNIPKREWMKSVRKQVIPRVSMSVYMDDYSIKEDVIDSLKSVCEQSVKPFEVVLIYNIYSGEPPTLFVNWLVNNNYQIPWRLQVIKGTLLPMKDDLVKASYGEAIDLSVKSEEMKATYFTVGRSGYIYPANYLDVIDKAINDELIPFVVILPDEQGNGLFIQRGLHNILQGNKSANGCNDIIEKVNQIAQEEATSHMIKRFDELVKMVS